MKKSVAVGLCLCLPPMLSGCVTVDDFIVMTPDQRVVSVCSNADAIRQKYNALVQANKEVSLIQADLRRGYKLYRDCRQVQVATRSETRCHETPHGTKCESIAIPQYRTVCRDVPVALDSNLEKEKLAHLKNIAATINSDYTASYESCAKLVMGMPPEVAFSYYKAGLAPQ